MDTSGFLRIRAVFDGAVKLPPTEWDSHVRAACGGDRQLIEEVLTLLSEYRHAPPSGAGGAAPVSGHPPIGPYRVLRELGAGGMGVVYLAVRDDGAFRKNVAVKLLRANVASSDLIQRFHQERQVLADLDHPNIARILDGGQTPEGLPYYVMDFVDGDSLDRYCDSQTLNLPARLRLFQQVARAVQYLHEHLVVHRDLKPSNIMITRDGVVKLLDFGIAKVQAPMGLAPDLTNPEYRLLTPNYASPEQVSGAAVDKASDIYSLGVILYQLITGRLPFENPADKLQRDSPLPSANIRVDLQRTPESTRELRRRMAGDLDQIVMLCLRRDPRQRYAAAGDLVADLDRFLEDRSVIARREPVMERTLRFLRRKRVAVGVAVLLAAALGTGAWQAVLAHDQSRIVRSREAEVRRLLDELDRRGKAQGAKGAKGKSTARPVAPSALLEDVRELRRVIERDLSSGGSIAALSPERRDLLDRTSRYLDAISAYAPADTALALEVSAAYRQIAALYIYGYRERAVRAFTNAALLISGVSPGDPLAGPYAQQWAAVADQIRELGGDVPSWTQTQAARTAPPRNVGDSARSFANPLREDPPQTTLPPPPPSAPSRPVDQAEYDQVRRLFAHAQARAETADEVMRQLQADAAGVGQSLRASTTSEYKQIRTALELARQDLESGNPASARENILAAETFATRVIREGGGR